MLTFRSHNISRKVKLRCFYRYQVCDSVMIAIAFTVITLLGAAVMRTYTQFSHFGFDALQSILQHVVEFVSCQAYLPKVSVKNGVADLHVFGAHPRHGNARRGVQIPSGSGSIDIDVLVNFMLKV